MTTLQTSNNFEVSEPQAAIINSPKQLNLFHSGVGSGKSHCMGIISLYYALNFPTARGLISANTYGQLSNSTLVPIFKVWFESVGLREDVHFVVDRQPPPSFKINGQPLKEYNNIVSFSNGALIFLASLDNYKMIDGLQVSWGLLDETKDTREEAVKDVILARLRENKIFQDEKAGELYDHIPTDVKVRGFNPLYIFTSPSKEKWIADMFKITENVESITARIFNKDDFYIGDFDDRRVVISSTYHNERNLPDNYIESRRKIWDETPGKTDMLIFGSPFGKTGGEWYSRFDRPRHIKSGLAFDPDLPMHVSFDFNVNPYMSAIISQIAYTENDRIVLRILREYALEHPNNTTNDVCNEIIFDYAGKFNMLYYYGDSTGKNRTTSTMDKSIRNNYDVIRTVLYEFIFEGSRRVGKSNPPTAGRREMMNRIMAGNASVDIEIDSSCFHLIQDIEFGKEGANGEYLKPKFRNPDTGSSFEKYGHHSDALIYLCWYHFKHLIKTE